ncbi:MAG: hypothetical protein EA402_02325 [Planctomycetota bacterium]|nr:MAG: hypothetical protein EA402_02325 [Planctomycetota bacterium]
MPDPIASQGGVKHVWKRNARFAGHAFSIKTPFRGFFLPDLEICGDGDKLCATLIDIRVGAGQQRSFERAPAA